LHDKELIT